MTAEKPLSLGERNKIISDLATLSGRDLEKLIDEKRVTEAERNRLKDEVEKYQHGSDVYQDRCTNLEHEFESAKSALREAQEFIKSTPPSEKHFTEEQVYGIKWYREEILKILGGSESCTKADVIDESWKTCDKGPSPVCKYCEYDSDCYPRFFNPDGSMKPEHPEFKAGAEGETPK